MKIYYQKIHGMDNFKFIGASPVSLFFTYYSFHSELQCSLTITVSFKQGERLKDPGVHDRIILKWILEKRNVGHVLDQSGSG
jgi:hypothetical protein